MITGSIVALATPMHDNGDIDWENLDRLVEFHIKEGTDAFMNKRKANFPGLCIGRYDCN